MAYQIHFDPDTNYINYINNWDDKVQTTGTGGLHLYGLLDTF